MRVQPGLLRTGTYMYVAPAPAGINGNYTYMYSWQPLCDVFDSLTQQTRSGKFRFSNGCVPAFHRSISLRVQDKEIVIKSLRHFDEEFALFLESLSNGDRFHKIHEPGQTDPSAQPSLPAPPPFPSSFATAHFRRHTLLVHSPPPAQACERLLPIERADPRYAG